MANTLQKTVRVTQDQWNRVTNGAAICNLTPNYLLVELATQAFDRREWP